MTEDYQIVAVADPEQSAWGLIGRGISSYNTQQAGKSGYQHLCFVLLGPDETIAGGVIAVTYYGWLYVDLLWVREDLRGRGYGDRLLALAEEEAWQRGAQHAYLDTFSFQAPDFYVKRGYRVFGELPDFPPGHRRYFLTKQLRQK
jgi:GNAT superfamily N-acetyltransferase